MKTATIAADYHSHIRANTTATQAFENICNVSAWWAKNFEGSSQKLDDVFTVRFGTTFVTFRITERVPHKWIVWGGVNSTQVNMKHVGLVSGIECYENCEKGWDRHIKESLFKLLTEQKGQPS